MAQAPEEEPSLQDIIGSEFLNGKHEKVSFKDEIEGLDLLGLYFSAHWCPPCRGFTPVLVENYQKWLKDNKKIKILFVTSDRNEEAFKEYFGTMDGFIALPYNDDRIKKIKTKYGIRGIPTLIILDKNGKTIDAVGRNTVANKKEKAIDDWLS